jgi:hypothetical protein
VLAFFRSVSPGWIDTMKIPFIGGRDFRTGDTAPGVAIVNEAFAKTYFNGENPIGRSFATTYKPRRFQIVGLVRDARYRTIREPIPPTAYVPFAAVDATGAFQIAGRATFIVRTSGADPQAIAPILRQEVSRARPEFRVSTMHTQTALNQSHTVRERLLAMLASFFAVVALLLAVALLAALPPVIRALRIDPVTMLRAE